MGIRKSIPILLLTTALALTAQAPERRGPGREGGFMRFHPVLSALDADHDGVISAAELAQAPQVLKNLDKNNDGTLAMEEMRPAPFGRLGGPGGPGGRPGERGERPNDGAAMADQLMQFDKNNDGALTKDEVPERMQGLFANADADKDGRLTKAELTQRANAAPSPQARAGAREGDDHHDQEGGRRGGSGGGGGGRGFRDPIAEVLDTNQDGVIDAAEIQASAKALAKLDRDGDGRLQEEEVSPRRRGPGGPPEARGERL